MSLRIASICLFLLAGLSTVAGAQPMVTVQEAELAIPFGVVPGELVIVGDYLVFVDKKSKESSFALSRGDIESLSGDAESLRIITRVPVRHRDQERKELQFRLKDATMAQLWYDAVSPAASATVAEASPAPAAKPAATLSYSAQHKHRFKECQGQLLVMADRVVFESIDELSHSRQWSLSDIRELKLKNPYELEVRPFTGNDYNFRLLGKGMEGDDFKSLVKRIAAARAGN